MHTHITAATHRLFFALWPHAGVRAAIAERAAAIEAECAPGGRAVVPPRYHLTLQFLGSFIGSPATCIDDAIRAAECVRCPEFTVVLDRAGSFERSRAWWLGCDVSPSLQRLHAQLAGALAAVGLPDATPFVPHVTLGRNLQRVLEPQAIDPLAWPLRDFVLVDSAAGAPAYRVVRRWPLDPISRGSQTPEIR